MSEQEMVNSDQPGGDRNSESPPEVGEHPNRETVSKEITALKEKHAAEIAALTEQVAALRDAVKESLSAAGSELGGSDTPSKTAGVKEPRGGARSVLAAAASQAVRTGSRTDVQEYLRLRRKFV